MKKLFTLLLLSSFALSAGELPGKWSGKFDVTNSAGETKPDSAFMNLKLEGSNITGTAGPNENRQWAINDGKLAAKKLTFKVEMEEGGFIDFELVFDGDAIRGSATGTGRNGEKMSAKVDLKRVN